MEILRGDIYYANLSSVEGSEQDGKRPVVIIQNNIGNFHSTTVIVASITTKKKSHMPTHVAMEGACGVEANSYIQLEQLRTLDKSRFMRFVGRLPENKMEQVNTALKISLAIG